MSKLYIKGITDRRKTPLTAMVRRLCNLRVLYNWCGGNSEHGDVFRCTVQHESDHIVNRMILEGSYDITHIIHENGTTDLVVWRKGESLLNTKTD
jgi:hypothetical protein